MKIKKITYQHRNDFHALLECEHCQHVQELKTGYDDAYYHQKVLPAMECKSCGKPGTDKEPEDEHYSKIE